MPRDTKTFRLTEFKGLNTSVNPHNIDDAEMTELVNMELTKDRTLQTRGGYSILASTFTPPSTDRGVARTLFKTTWGTDSALYCHINVSLYKIDETTGSITSITSLPSVNGHIQFRRYKDKVLLLVPGNELKWFDSSENVKDVSYPYLKVGTNWASALSNTAGGDLPDLSGDSKLFQYNISLGLGIGNRDGESCGADPGDTIDRWARIDPNVPVRGLVDPRYIYGDYARCGTTTENKTITATGLLFNGSMNGWKPDRIYLYRRTVYWDATSLKSKEADEDWALLDTAYLEEVAPGGTFSISGTKNRFIQNTTTITVDPTTDAVVVSLNFIDTGIPEPNANFKFRTSASEQRPKAKYMTRFNNRIFLAHMVDSLPEDKKLVWFSYRPGNPNGEEIQGYLSEPMLVFPPGNTFYCDIEDIDDEITAIYTFQDNVIVFTANCMFLWREGMRDPAKIANDVGCIAQHTIREFEGKLIWLAKNGVYTFNGTKLDNLSYEKVNDLVTSVSIPIAHFSSACIYDRRYWLLVPASDNIPDKIIVYDFDLNEWHTREYRYSETYSFRPIFIYSYRKDNQEMLYASGLAGDYTSHIARLENVYADNGMEIIPRITTKYLDFKAPDVQKMYRSLYVDIEDYTRALTVDLYIDSLDSARESITYPGGNYGFIVNDTSGSRGVVNVNYLQNVTDEMVGFSLNRGMIGSRIKMKISFRSLGTPAKLHALALDWRPARRARRNYGDGS